MSIVFWILLVLIFPFAFVLKRGAPYVPTRKRGLQEFLKKLDLPEGSNLVDIGSGDGQVLKVAAKDFGFSVVGVELNVILVLISRLRLAFVKNSKVVLGDMWKYEVPAKTNVIFIFILPKYIDEMTQHIQRSIASEVVLISYSFDVPGHTPFSTSTDGFRAYKLKPLAKA